ncbi:heterokaryon incompatibility protein [Colletotrichum incanum]|uniref:Heterokaryon incompatibility protein n=1 Tax=Colletotrichum incanum TaxID=1573173 RepID=A0A166RR15_COLIC|nr:heterokaryon incompatibility protein [Colletotrichum incanum]
MLDHSWLGWSTLAEPKTEGTLSRSWCFQEECEFPVTSVGLVTIKELYEPRFELSSFETPNWMWQSTVEHYTRLCWAPVRTKETERTLSLAYVAPSWSWAAHNGPITIWIPYAGSEEPIKPQFLGKTSIRKVSVTPATQDDAGAVTGGSITVRGVFLKVLVEATSNEQLTGVMARNGIKIAFNFDRPLGVTSLVNRYFCWVVCIFPGQSSREREPETYCLIVLRGRPGGPGHICERVGFVDYEAIRTNTSTRFFKGYRNSIRIAVIF